jgi:O-antigen ligase
MRKGLEPVDMTANLHRSRAPIHLEGSGYIDPAEQRKQTFLRLPFLFAVLFILVSTYLDLPIYFGTVKPELLPKYWFTAFLIISLPWTFINLSGRAPYSAAPYTLWATAYVILTSFHWIAATSDGETTRAAVIETKLQYVILSGLLGVAFSAVTPKQYTFVFPILVAIISSLIIVDFLDNGKFYSYDIVGAVVGRGAGTFINSTRAGEALIITLLLTMVRFRGLLLLLLLLFAGLAALLTFSRAAIIAWVLIWPFALRTKRLPAYTYAVLFGLFFVVPLIITALINYTSLSTELAAGQKDIMERLSFFEEYSLEDASARERSEVLWAGIDVFLNHPFFGAGAGYTFVWEHNVSTHNEIVLLAAEYGIFGIVLWIWMAYILWNGSYFSRRDNQISIALYFMYFSMFSHNLFDFSPYILLAFAFASQRRRPDGLRLAAMRGP